MTHQEFVSSAVNRKRYWARSLRGWRFFDQAQPNVAHRALGKLEQQGYVRTVVTQNVDGLHQRLGKEGWQRLGKPLPPREVRPFTCKALSAICGIDVRMSVRPISQFDDSRPRGLSVAREVCLSSMFQSFPSSFQPTPGRAARQRSSSCNGRNDEVQCLSCFRSRRRSGYQEELETVNSEWMDHFLPRHGQIDVRADGDAELQVQSFEAFHVPSCDACGGVWKPKVVFFGGALEESVKGAAREAVETSGALLVMGSSLQVFSAFSLVKEAAALQKPLAILNIGPTRADPQQSRWLTWRREWRCGETLEEICRRLRVAVS
ncbi:unnamed protein product [Durusdinium trenchii]